MSYTRRPQAPEGDSGDDTSGFENKLAPKLPPALYVSIPEASLRYLLIHHLALSYQYTKKKATFTEPKKRHQRICKFIIELNRAGRSRAVDTNRRQLPSDF